MGEQAPESPAPVDRGAGAVTKTRLKKSTRRASFGRRFRRDWQLLLLVAPTILLLLIFHYYPLLGNIIAFQEFRPYKGILGSNYVGLQKFQALFSDSAFWNALRNTLYFMLIQLVFFFPIPIVLAIMLHGIISTKLKRLVQNIVYLPYFMSWVVVVALFQQIFGGAGIFAGTRFDELSNVMTNADTFAALLTAQAIWKDAGWGAIIFLAALTTIPQDLYEAAASDGAGRWHRLWHVTLPGLRPVIILLLILRLGDALTVGFEQILLQRDAVGAQASEVIDTYVYFTGVVQSDWSLGAAAGLFKGVVGTILIFAANKLAHRLGESGVYSRS